MACSAQELFYRLAPLMPGGPAWLYLEQRGIPGGAIAAHQDQLRYLEADIPGRPRGEHALAALIRDAATGEVVAYQLSFCDPLGGRVARTKEHPPKMTRLLRTRGSLAGLFLIGEPEPGGRLFLVEGRAEKALMIAAAGLLPVAGFGGRQVLGRQALPAVLATAIVVPDRRPEISMGADMLRDVARAEAHDCDYARGIARLELGGLTVMRVADPIGDGVKDADDFARVHGLEELRALIDAAELAERSVEGEALKIAAIADGAARDQALRAATAELGVGFKALAEKVQRLRRRSAAKEREEWVTSAPTGMISRQPPFVVVRREYKTRDGTVRAPGLYFGDYVSCKPPRQEVLTESETCGMLCTMMDSASW